MPKPVTISLLSQTFKDWLPSLAAKRQAVLLYVGHFIKGSSENPVMFASYSEFEKGLLVNPRPGIGGQIQIKFAPLQTEEIGTSYTQPYLTVHIHNWVNHKSQLKEPEVEFTLTKEELGYIKTQLYRFTFKYKKSWIYNRRNHSSIDYSFTNIPFLPSTPSYIVAGLR